MLQTRCQNCGRPLRLDSKELRIEQRLPLYGAATSVVCGARCEHFVELTRALIANGWALTLPMLRQEALA